MDLEFTSMLHSSARWISKDDVKNIKTDSRAMLVEDLDGNPVLLFENDFVLRTFTDKYPDVKLSTIFEG
ncbi:peptide chain release factor 3 [compost metagenome]